jgi:hypothetical protein
MLKTFLFLQKPHITKTSLHEINFFKTLTTKTILFNVLENEKQIENVLNNNKSCEKKIVVWCF